MPLFMSLEERLNNDNARMGGFDDDSEYGDLENVHKLGRRR